MTLSEQLLAALTRYGDLPCLTTPSATYSYADLRRAACGLTHWFADANDPDAPVAILADHSFLGYAAVVAALVAQRPYVPIKPGSPPDRVRAIMRLAGCRHLVADESLLGAVAALMEEGGLALATVPPVADTLARAEGARSDRAYIMFTSGSTGTPKGVVLSPANLVAYHAAARALFALRPDDRCTQLFDLSFDLSVHDLLMTFLAGAQLVVDPERQRIDPIGFAAQAGATVWFSVPSVLSMAKRFRRLKPNALPTLRLSLFCGEALPTSLAIDWLAAAPDARVFNVYGPTEATIAITHYEIDRAAAASDLPTVPIGWPYAGAELAVVDESGRAGAEQGELWLAGPQLATGYLDDPAQTADKFVARTLPGFAADRWYRTGDLVETSAAHGLIFCGRLDQQVKIGGYRVELAEVEAAVRTSDANGEAAAVSYRTAAGVQAIGCFVTDEAMARDALAACRRLLPDYMVPSIVTCIEHIPLNPNGKVDRNALRRLIER